MSWVKNQGNCGSCWSFATYGSLESFLLPAETWDFSEEDLIDHDGFDMRPVLRRKLHHVHGVSRPLERSSERSGRFLSGAIEGAGTAQKHVQNVIFIPTRTGFTDNDNIKQAVMTYGACYISFYWADSYYNAAHYAYYYPSATGTNHAVTLIGWDDNFDKNNFNPVPAGNGAFLIKNSWGTSWGQNGYFWISYYDATFLYHTSAAVFTGESTENYSGIYQYDPLGWVNTWGWNSATPTVAYCANIFTAASSNPLKAVATYATSSSCSYTISVYTSVTAGNPISGNLMATKSGTLISPGYYTIPLDSTVPLTSGQLFSVVVRYETPGYNWPMPTEEVYSGYSSSATASAGQSYWSYNGTSWSDAYDATSKRNVCIKAFTQVTTVQPIIAGTVRTAGGTGLANVTIGGLPASPVTPASGAYSNPVSPGWSGTATPTAATYTFSPSSRSYTSVMANQFNQDYTASATGCSYIVSPTAASYDVGGGSNSVSVACGGACIWSAASNDSWIHITSGSSGTGNGTVQYSVDAATGLPSRTGTMTVAGQTVTISERGDDAFQTPAGYIVLPECIWALATGGGTWVSEVQITDITGGSMVSAYFSYGGGGRRGPITVWNNGGADKSSIKFSNLLSFLGSIDTGFTYYGKVGTVEFQTQDSSHRIQVGARTLNGNYSKTFPGLAPSMANIADTTKPMMIQNFTNNATYRSTCGFFNPTVDSLTVQFRLCDAAGATIGATFSKTFAGFDFQAFSPFTEAGVPYPTYSYDNAYLKVTPTSGTGKLVCFGASANNTSNDPAAHLAVQYQGTDDNSPSNQIVLPECIWAPASGGGTWVSEVQITDLSGGSAVSASFYPGGGAARLSIPMWTNAGGSRLQPEVQQLPFQHGRDRQFLHLQRESRDGGVPDPGRIAPNPGGGEDPQRELRQDVPRAAPGGDEHRRPHAPDDHPELHEQRDLPLDLRLLQPDGELGDRAIHALRRSRRAHRLGLLEDLRGLRFPGLQPVHRGGGSLSLILLRRRDHGGKTHGGQRNAHLFRRLGQQHLERPGGPHRAPGSVSRRAGLVARRCCRRRSAEDRGPGRRAIRFALIRGNSGDTNLNSSLPRVPTADL